MTATVDLPEDAVARVQAQPARRGDSIDSVIAELTTALPAEPHPRKAHSRVQRARLVQFWPLCR